MKPAAKSSRYLWPVGLFFGLVALIGTTLTVYRPDRPLAHIVPGTSSEPTFVVQLIRPRAGLPLGGLLPPELFGQDEQLRFDSKSPGATVRHVDASRLELAADGWELVLVVDEEGQVSPDTQVVFELLFQESPRVVRCRPGEEAMGALETSVLDVPGALSGHFEVELARCEDSSTGKSLGWPPKPLVLRGSFDRLPALAAHRTR